MQTGQIKCVPIGTRTNHTVTYDDAKDCCEPKQPGEVHQSIMRLNDAITDLEKRVGDFMPRLASVQKRTPVASKGEQTKAADGDCGVELANRILQAYDRIQRLIGIVHDNGEILDL